MQTEANSHIFGFWTPDSREIYRTNLTTMNFSGLSTENGLYCYFYLFQFRELTETITTKERGYSFRNHLANACRKIILSTMQVICERPVNVLDETANEHAVRATSFTTEVQMHFAVQKDVLASAQRCDKRCRNSSRSADFEQRANRISRR